MVRAVAVGERPERAGLWSHAAFWLATAGVLAAVWVILGSDGDPQQVRWWLVVAPLAISLAPLLVPRRGARLGAAVLLGGWFVLTGFSIGFLLLPALAGLAAAAVRESS